MLEFIILKEFDSKSPSRYFAFWMHSFLRFFSYFVILLGVSFSPNRTHSHFPNITQKTQNSVETQVSIDWAQSNDNCPHQHCDNHRASCCSSQTFFNKTEAPTIHSKTVLINFLRTPIKEILPPFLEEPLQPPRA